jgi:AcrR family transcriptional regulator
MGAKGDATRQAILDRAFELARHVGLEGLTIGHLADDLDLSKSGLFAHFHSKEALQIQVLEAAAARFVDEVVRPALAAPRGEPRMRALFERWLEWLQRTPGGCIFVQAAAELDDREGPARDRLVQLQRDWLDVIATTVTGAIRDGQFKPSVDPEQFAHDLNGIVLAYHHAARLLRDVRADARARAAFDALVASARAVHPATPRRR